MRQPTTASYQVIDGAHTVLAGISRGRYVSVCLECGKLLGIVPSLHLVTVLEGAHVCSGPRGRLEAANIRPAFVGENIPPTSSQKH